MKENSINVIINCMYKHCIQHSKYKTHIYYAWVTEKHTGDVVSVITNANCPYILRPIPLLTPVEYYSPALQEDLSTYSSCESWYLDSAPLVRHGCV